MTRKQQEDLFNMPKIATPVNPINGLWKKLFGTWSAIGGRKPKRYPYVVGRKPSLSERINAFILHLRLWMWAAVHDKDFWQFEIGFSKIINVTANYYPSSFEFLLITISFNKPIFYMFEPGLVVNRFCREFDISDDILYPDNPF